jgi:hypothetical protein
MMTLMMMVVLVVVVVVVAGLVVDVVVLIDQYIIADRFYQFNDFFKNSILYFEKKCTDRFVSTLMELNF